MGECIYDNPPTATSGRRSETTYAVRIAMSGDQHGMSLPTPEDQVSNVGTHHGQLSTIGGSTPIATPLSQASTHEMEALRNRIRLLEGQVSHNTSCPAQSLISTPASNTETSSSQLGGTFHIHSQLQPDGAIRLPRVISHKTRMFGQSHFVTGLPLLSDVMEMIDQGVIKNTDLITCMQKCKVVARRIKAQRAPEWPTPFATQLLDKALSDDLVECYLGTVEKIYRILHIPTFKKKYDALWTSESEPDRDFLAQLKLVHALGATIYGDKFPLRSSAIRWIYEVQTWISEPEFKSRLGIQFLQTNILLVLAREIVAVGGESPWIAFGSLLRTAVSMGLHRDPTLLSTTTTFPTEMRRRLWSTILELCLQSSLSTGGPPMISIGDFDTEPPGNFDDDQIMAEKGTPRPENIFTQMSTSRALRKTFSTRLKVAQLLNDLRTGDSYKDTLSLDAELKASYKEAIRILQATKKTETSSTRFELSAVDFIMRRYLCALHFPFFALSLQDPRYAFSRKMTFETAFKMWSAVSPTPTVNSSDPTDATEFSRFVTYSAGMFRTAAWQANLILVCELRNQIQEDDSLSPPTIRSDLMGVMEDARAWNLQCIEAGETSVKGVLTLSIVLGHIKSIMQNASKEETAQGVIKAGEEAENEALVILESILAQLEPQSAEQDSLDQAFDFTGDWDMTIADDIFNDGAFDLLEWIF
ncbi:Ff.00g015260.m01.CDS01 [Fusarium sp. VM40]|nr:Ff.00g015260.m01.CDS01 [Fusarium sp. VM40]